ncbi:MAG TPA: glycosyltransferase family 1 protein [Candidatus Obscuribacterales bacterium]
MPSNLIVNLSFLLNRPTGISNYAVNLLPQLQPLNPTLLTSQTFPDYNCYQVPANQTSEQGAKGHFRRLLWTQLQLPKIYKKLRSHLLFSPIPEAPLFSNCRFLVMVHDAIPLRFPKAPLTQYFRYYVPSILAQAEHILCNSNATAQDITDFFHIPAKKITSIHLAHDANHFRNLDLPTRNYFLYIGRREPYKNLHRLIDAFATLANCCDYELWLAGPSDRRYTPLLMAQVEKLELTANVKFLDYVPYAELPTLINQAIALVFPSLWEGFGLPVLEAMACGTPVITSNISSLPEVTNDAAILVNPYKVEEIAEAMQAVVNDSGLRDRLRQAGIARSSQFSWEKTGKATVEVLQKYL